MNIYASLTVYKNIGFYRKLNEFTKNRLTVWNGAYDLTYSHNRSDRRKADIFLDLH